MSMKKGHFVTGITRNNGKFRPSDWVERTASVCAFFDRRCCLHYNQMLRPIEYDGLHGLYIAFELQKLNPYAYEYAMDFALGNKLQIIDIGMNEELHAVA